MKDDIFLRIYLCPYFTVFKFHSQILVAIMNSISQICAINFRKFEILYAFRLNLEKVKDRKEIFLYYFLKKKSKSLQKNK